MLVATRRRVAMAEGQDRIYYDIVLTGKTGMGKSTLGNKLLQVRDNSVIQRYTSTFVGLLRPAQSALTCGQNRFATTDDLPPGDTDERGLSVTPMCELLANDKTKVRVLDVPGFSDSDILQRGGISIYEGNLQVIRQIVRVQAVMKLQVQRVVYFLPVRGILEKADGSMQGELKVMHHFFGAAIFNCMVVIATNHLRYQQQGYDKDCLEESKRVFHLALKRATGDDKIGCPPVVYVGVHDSSAAVTEKIKSAEVLTDTILELKFRNDVCSRCSLTILRVGQSEIVGVVNAATGTVTEYDKSKCHPCFVQKYANWEKFLGGFVHIYTLGIAALAAHLRGSTTWPGFTNSDEKCPSCQKSPGSQGCQTAGETITCNWLKPPCTMQVDHTNNL